MACDCVGLIRGVYRVLTGKELKTTVDYPATWHLFKGEPWLLNECRSLAGPEIDVSKVRPGDILTFSFRDKFVDHHIGIMLEGGMFIHSYMDVGFVVVTRLDDTWKGRLRHAFCFPEVED